MEGERKAASYSNPLAIGGFCCGMAAAVMPLIAVAARLCCGDGGVALDFLLLTPCLGVVLGPYAAALAYLGLRHAARHPTAGGGRLAAIGLVLGLLASGAYLLLMLPVFRTAW